MYTYLYIYIDACMYVCIYIYIYIYIYKIYFVCLFILFVNVTIYKINDETFYYVSIFYKFSTA